jgi:hypothetical protein
VSQTSPAITFRNAVRADLDGILEVEQSWPESGRAGADKFLARLERFPEGFFVAGVMEAGREKLVATLTSMPVQYDPAHLEAFRGWDAVTNGGYLFPDMNLARCNAIYIVSGVIDNACHGLNLFEPGVLLEVDLAERLALRYVIGGAVLPGYRRFCERHGPLDAYAYCRRRRGETLADPLLAMYESIGFSVPDASHVIPEYYPDDASRNYAALVVREVGASKPLTARRG